METSVRIELNKELYVCGDEVRGAIEIKTRNPLCISKINLKLLRKMEMNIQRTEEGKHEEDTFEAINRSINKYCYQFQVYANDDPLEEISSGHHRFPFKFGLRRDDGGSSEVKGVYFDLLCSIKGSYELHADIHMLGIHNPVYSAHKEMQVIENCTEPKAFHATVEIQSPICLFTRKYDVSFELNKQFYFSGDALAIRACIPSKTPKIKCMECFLYEILSISANGQEEIRTKYIAGGEGVNEEEGRASTLCLRIPSTTSSTFTDNDAGMRIVLFISLGLSKGAPIKIKKYLQIVKKRIAYPEIDSINVLEGEIYPEKVFVLS
ncbi:hypothetical protein CWI42_052010 [Ordospora colligata]|uniref:Arrestin-like N-terminal domain-containing protein n=1 Tax=Ordospora colligata OC4 TaxID=1354746 RepID=A0A0B2UFG8_9MICR|nr:uncharacterized protein M896_052060 [Ordospora colligata OC4]KHN69796.1 hypothetical protein M896_052060 [Ordospora colligata OC4]TBU15599.1 hypothetical protein CWI41_052050 [Ordospora colligata]TBU15666.1 hypothetical protein CWI40_052030 [Ordospora colligata]TBU18717.1 hypothetical protein CWI42_052010 [Ordospora colligata]